MRSLVATIVALSGCTQMNEVSPPPDPDFCSVDPSTSTPRVDIDPSVVAFADEPITVTAGWTDACSPALCYLDTDDYVCAPPSVDATVTVSGVAADIAAAGSLSID